MREQGSTSLPQIPYAAIALPKVLPGGCGLDEITGHGINVTEMPSESRPSPTGDRTAIV